MNNFEKIPGKPNAYNENPYGVVPQPRLKYENPTPGELPIVSSGKLPYYTYYSADLCRLIKECHINAFQCMTNEAGAFDNGKDPSEKDYIPYVTCGEGKDGKQCSLNIKGKTAYLNYYESILNARSNGLKVIARLSFDGAKTAVQVNPYYNYYNNEIEEYKYYWANQYDRWNRLTHTFKNSYPLPSVKTEDDLDRETVIGWMLSDEPAVSGFAVLREMRYVILQQENNLFEYDDYRDTLDNEADKQNIHLLELDVAMINNHLDEITDYNHKTVLCNLLPYLNPVGENVNGVLNIQTVWFQDPLGSGTNVYWSGVNSYKEYVDDYVNNMNPTVLCFDAYPFECNWRNSNSANENDRKTVLTPRFIQTLSFYYNYRRRNRIPFWSTILALKIVQNQTGTDKEGKIEHRFGNITWNDTVAKLRFSVFASLAFGAQGLMIWRMASEPFKNKDEKFEINGTTYYKEAYEDIPISAKCTKNPSYYRLQEVLAEVRKLQKVFIDEPGYAISDIAVGITDVPTGKDKEQEYEDYYKEVELPLMNYGGLEAKEPFNSVIKTFLKGSEDAKGWIVTKITKESISNGSLPKSIKEYLIFVNLDVENNQSLKVLFQSKMKNETDAPEPSIPIQPGFPSDNSIIMWNNPVEPGGWKIYSRTT